MTFFVRRCLQIFLIIEIIFFIIFYCFGPKGLKSLYDIEYLCKKTKIEITELTQEITDLQQKSIENKTEFFKEKIAREQLLMKKENEIVYLKNSKD